jgi:hypothetical protein
LTGGVAGFVEGGGGGSAESVGADPGEFVGVGGLGRVVDLGEQAVQIFEPGAVDRYERGDQLMVYLDAAGFDELDPGLWPAEVIGDLFAGQAGFAAECSQAEAKVAAGGIADGGEGGAESAAGVGRVAVAADGVGELRRCVRRCRA